MEEDIDVTIKELSYMEESYEENGYMSIGDFNTIYRAIDLLKGYRELEEERRMFYRGNVYTTNQLKNSIPKSKIKEKIEELEKYIYKGENAPQDFLQYRIKAKIQVLQELMEDK